MFGVSSTVSKDNTVPLKPVFSKKMSEEISKKSDKSKSDVSNINQVEEEVRISRDSPDPAPANEKPSNEEPKKDELQLEHQETFDPDETLARAPTNLPMVRGDSYNYDVRDDLLEQTVKTNG